MGGERERKGESREPDKGSARAGGKQIFNAESFLPNRSHGMETTIKAGEVAASRRASTGAVLGWAAPIRLHEAQFGFYFSPSFSKNTQMDSIPR